MDEPRLVPDHVPVTWTASAAQTCACATPVPSVHAERKGAARTLCARCGLPIKVRFGW